MSLTSDVEWFQAKLARDPSSLVFAQLADAYRKRGRLEEAIHVCQKGLSHHPNYASAYLILGRAYEEKGDLLAAREAFQRVLEIDSESVLAHRFLGQIAEVRNEVPEALEAYRTALTLHPFDKEIRAAVERLEAQTAGEVVWARREVAEADQQPSAPEAEPVATETLAELYATQGQYDRAAEIYDRLVTEAPDRDDLRQKYGEALTRLRATAGRQISASLTVDEALPLLGAWRDSFRRLKGRGVKPVPLLEAWRDAFRRLRGGQVKPVPLLEAWRDSFRRPKGRQVKAVPLLEAWRDAFRRLKVGRGETR